MFTLSERLAAFEALRMELLSISADLQHPLYAQAQAQNGWFVPRFVQASMQAIAQHMLQPTALATWAAQYDLSPSQPKNVAVIMAGNIPLVGFHDAMCVLLAGHHLRARLSSTDTVLMGYVLQFLKEETPVFANSITIINRISKPDAVIATGGDSSNLHFQYYFGKYPHLLRGNRSSVAVLTGQETEEDLEGLSHDVFMHFGLGCRSVSKLLVPADYDVHPLLQAFAHYAWLGDTSKWGNNYDYQRAVALINTLPGLDAHFYLLRPSSDSSGPTSVLYYEEYKDQAHLQTLLKAVEAKTQIVVGKGPGMQPFGTGQQPACHQYADGVDTLAFLSSLN